MFLLLLMMLDGPYLERFIVDEALYNPIAMRVHPSGDLYLVDAGAHEVRIYTPSGTYKRVIGGPGQGPGEYQRPTDVAFLADGRLVVVDSEARRLQLYDADLNFIKAVKTPEQPLGQIFVLPDGNLLLTRSQGFHFKMSAADSNIQRFGIYNPEGKRLRGAGGWEGENNPLYAVILNGGPAGLLGDTVVVGGMIDNKLRFIKDDSQTNRILALPFDPEEPKAERSEDGANFSMKFNEVCKALTVGPKQEIYLIVAASAEEDTPDHLIEVDHHGKTQKTWQQTFFGRALAVSADGQWLYILNDLEEDVVVSRIAR